MHVELKGIEKEGEKQEDNRKENYTVRDLDEDRDSESKQIKRKDEGGRYRVKYAEEEHRKANTDRSHFAKYACKHMDKKRNVQCKNTQRHRLSLFYVTLLLSDS